MSADRLKASIDETGTTEDNNTSANLSNSSENMENANENVRTDAVTADGMNNPKVNVSQQPQPNENTTNSTNDSESSLNEYNGDSVMTMARSANVINDSMVKHEPNSGDKIEPDANPVELIKKLEIVKEIRTKTANLEQIKSKLVEEFECIETESKCLQTFQSELDALIQEKMAHLEELRQIQNDITNMEYTIKQSDEEKKRAIESIVRLHLEYKPLKGELNHLREMVGLDKKCENEEIEMIESFLRKLQPFAAESKSNNNSNSNNSNENKSVNSGSGSSRHGSSNSNHPPPLIVKSPNRVEQQQYHSASSSANSPMTHNNSTNAKTNTSSAAAKAKHEQELIDANTAALAQNILAQRAAAAASMNPLLFSNPKAYIANMQNAPKTPFDLQAQLATMALMTQSLRPQSPLFNESQAPQHHHHHHHHQQEQFNKQFIPGGKSQKSELPGSNSTSNPNPQVNSNQAQPQPQSPQIQPQSNQLQNMQPTFRQQPPPMKSCLSCNQQIHRNAPICPLCKAKSRSVNPKKPKKKQPETNIANQQQPQQQQNSSSNASHQQMTPHKKGPGRHAADHLSNIKKELAH